MKAKLAYTGIRVQDLDKSIRFYTTVLGMTARARNPVESAQGVVVDLVSEDGGPVLELNYYESGSAFDTRYDAGEALDHLAFKVPDLDQAIAEAEKAGFPVVREMKGSTSRWVYIQDPNGIWIELFT
jgi:lactoylglutathione lyase